MRDQPFLLERDPRLRDVWPGQAVGVLYASGQRCGRVRSDDYRPPLVNRQPRARRRLCFACWLDTRRRR
jgi:hypothetical protein